MSKSTVTSQEEIVSFVAHERYISNKKSFEWLMKFAIFDALLTGSLSVVNAEGQRKFLLGLMVVSIADEAFAARNAYKYSKLARLPYMGEQEATEEPQLDTDEESSHERLEELAETLSAINLSKPAELYDWYDDAPDLHPLLDEYV